jgi:hypothetical protein
MGSDGGLTPGQTGRLIVGRKITLASSLEFSSVLRRRVRQSAAGQNSNTETWQAEKQRDKQMQRCIKLRFAPTVRDGRAHK